MTQLSKPMLGSAFLDSEMLQEHGSRFKRCFPLQKVVTAVTGAPGFLFAHFDTALKFEFTGHQNVPNSLCWEIG